MTTASTSKKDGEDDKPVTALSEDEIALLKNYGRGQYAK